MLHIYIAGNIGVILGDSAYALKRYLLTPFVDPQTPEEKKFNNALCKTRVTVECAYGILRNRFQCLMKPLRVIGPEALADVVLACIVLHNIAIQKCDLYRPLPRGQNIWLANDEIGDNSNAEGRRVRDQFVRDYFS